MVGNYPRVPSRYVVAQIFYCVDKHTKKPLSFSVVVGMEHENNLQAFAPLKRDGIRELRKKDASSIRERGRSDRAHLVTSDMGE